MKGKKSHELAVGNRSGHCVSYTSVGRKKTLQSVTQKQTGSDGFAKRFLGNHYASMEHHKRRVCPHQKTKHKISRIFFPPRSEYLVCVSVIRTVFQTVSKYVKPDPNGTTYRRIENFFEHLNTGLLKQGIF